MQGVAIRGWAHFGSGGPLRSDGRPVVGPHCPIMAPAHSLGFLPRGLWASAFIRRRVWSLAIRDERVARLAALQLPDFACYHHRSGAYNYHNFQSTPVVVGAWQPLESGRPPNMPISYAFFSAFRRHGTWAERAPGVSQPGTAEA